MKKLNYRQNTKPIFVNKVKVGGQNKVVIQSMTTEQPKNISKTIKQIHSLENVGCEMVRMAIYDKADADAIPKIKAKVNIPLIADIHFNYTLAFSAIENGIDKIRINPGTIGANKDTSASNLRKITQMCQKFDVPIRVGVNSGSLEKDIIKKYGWTSDAMIASAKRNVKLLEDQNFENIVISLKTSEVQLAIECYQKAAEIFKYPLHLGITEAGSLLRGSVKSAAGLGILLNQGIGDTIRISLSCDPVKEILVAKQLLSSLQLANDFPELVACPTCGRLQYEMFPVVDEIEKFLDTLRGKIRVAIMGCPVNGIGEARESDVALAGGHHQGLLYVNGEYKRTVKKADMVDELKTEIIDFLKKNEEKNSK